MKKKAKRSFIFNIEWQEVLMEYPTEVRLEVYDAIIEYAASGTLSELKPLAKMAFSFIKKEIDYYNDKYNETLSKRSEAGKKGMLSRYSKQQEVTSVTNVTSDNKTNPSYQTVTNVTDNVNDNESKETSSNEEAKKAALSLDAKEKELRELEASLKAKEEELAKREAALKAKPAKASPNLDFVGEAFREIFQTWLDYKKERKESYKSEKSIKIAYNQLLKFSDNNPEKAKLVVEQSIASNWAGLFELKNMNHNKPNIADYDNRINNETTNWTGTNGYARQTTGDKAASREAVGQFARAVLEKYKSQDGD